MIHKDSHRINQSNPTKLWSGSVRSLWSIFAFCSLFCCCTDSKDRVNYWYLLGHRRYFANIRKLFLLWSHVIKLNQTWLWPSCFLAPKYLNYLAFTSLSVPDDNRTALSLMSKFLFDCITKMIVLSQNRNIYKCPLLFCITISNVDCRCMPVINKKGYGFKWTKYRNAFNSVLSLEFNKKNV